MVGQAEEAPTTRPKRRRLRQPASQALAAKLRARVDVQDVAAAASGADHMRRPVHQPQPGAGRRAAILRDGEPCEIGASAHFLMHPWDERVGHRVEHAIVVVAHVEEHRAALGGDGRSVFRRGRANGEHSPILPLWIAREARVRDAEATSAEGTSPIKVTVRRLIVRGRGLFLGRHGWQSSLKFRYAGILRPPLSSSRLSTLVSRLVWRTGEALEAFKPQPGFGRLERIGDRHASGLGRRSRET
jgi:hypothetical protein